ncbi:MAG TPA: class I SAM-dependent methyltransferase [Arenimonas sp.]|uniref:class I SAM-dependent methyltransferase n=1 Tax=Arenimonas sp. TaxID=1872635 RepID=UPI002D7F4EB9|nr:class I SAM-dependent methyltransferase [Arenimonas sp.]HEU0152738.1 class I SAM-dependent methyltransferase [Arenimonas sp.]
MDFSKDIRFHDAIADEYDAVVLAPREAATARLFAPLLRRLAAHAPFEQMLDLGCGTGHMIRRAAPLAARVTGVDHSAGMLASAQRMAAAHGLAHVRFEHGDLATYLAARPDHADLVTAVGVLHHLDEADLERVLAAIHRSLRPGGWVLLAEPAIEDGMAEPAAITRWNQASLAARRSHATAEEDPDEAPLPLARLQVAIARAGFAPVLQRRGWEIYNHSEQPGLVERLRIAWLQWRHRDTGFIYACLARKA